MEQRDIFSFLIGTIAGFAVTLYICALAFATDFHITPAQTKQQIISFPNGAVFKKITNAQEVEE